MNINNVTENASKNVRAVPACPLTAQTAACADLRFAPHRLACEGIFFQEKQLYPAWLTRWRKAVVPSVHSADA
ncbi:MAG: hypothetical protein NTW32_22700 [Chloroflexi bacterium]|nr:hypothetical protein [Chloroflexota bacterium]